MADAGRGHRKQRAQLASEEEELRSLRIPVARGNLSPSKNSFLPTLQEQAQEQGQATGQRASSRGGETSGSRGGGGRDGLQRKQASVDEQEVTPLSTDLLESVKADFIAAGGSVDLERFVKAMLRSLEPHAYAPAEASPKKLTRVRSRGTPVGGVRFGTGDEEVGAGGYPNGGGSGLKIQDPARVSSRAASVIDLFRKVDVHGEGVITWEEVSNYLIEAGMSGGDEFTIDSIKTYEASHVWDQSKHESSVEKLRYFEQIDAVVCLSHNCRNFRLYDPKRCTVRHEVPGHRGTVVNCCFVDYTNQIATTGADMAICMWETTNLALRSRMSAKDVQLCLQADPTSASLFSGAIDGTLSRWDLQNMCLADTRRGQHKQAINDLLYIGDINLLASASSDGTILMWDAATMKAKKMFKGHKKGASSLAYSNDYRCLLTSGLDQEALVWNPYVERVPIFRLKGHTHSLCGVSVVPGTPQILSADVAGTFRLWDMRNFRCVQSFGGNDTQVNDLNTFCNMPPHRRLAAGGPKVVLYDYMDEWGGESVTDTGGITDALYNPNAGEFYTVTKKTVKAWNASTGTLFKVLRDVTQHEITAACLSDNGRKLYLGDACGRVAAHGLNNGRLLTQFEPHATDISCLGIWKGTNKLFSSSWDGVVKVQSDERHRHPQMKAEFQHHRDGVTCLACSPELMLLATGGTDMQVCLYDLKTLKFEHSLKRMQHVISGLDFLGSRCLLAVADQGGYVSLWRVRPHPDKWDRVFYFKNARPMSALDGEVVRLPAPAEANGPPIPLSSILFGPLRSKDKQNGKPQPLLYTADAKGSIRCWDLSVLCQRRNVVDEDMPKLFEQNYYAQLAAANSGLVRSATAAALGNTPAGGMVARVGSPVAHSASGAGSSAPETTSAGAFLTSLEGASGGGSGGGGGGGEDMTGAESREPVQRTTVRSAFQWNAAGAQSQDSNAVLVDEVKLLFEAEAHWEAVLGLHLARDPAALLSCGLDRRVCTWSHELDRFGVLLQSKDQAFGFPYNPTVARRTRLDEGAEVLRRIGPWSPGPKLPPLTPSGSRSPPDVLSSLGGGGSASSSRRRSRVSKDANPTWRSADILLDPDRVEEDSGIGSPLEILPLETPERLFRRGHMKLSGSMPQRAAALSKDEAAAADRLARAMAALGCDEFGTMRAMAKSVQPKLREPVAVHAD